ncbi:MAG TPA: PilZ domain-containing protein, partial [Bryobacteraceae bacterium]
RSADRFPMDREIRYRVLERKSSEPFRLGKTINMSSNGVLFTTDRSLNSGRYLELSISWPAQLDSKVGLKLMARGRVARADQNGAAVQIHQYEFRTCGADW